MVTRESGAISNREELENWRIGEAVGRARRLSFSWAVPVPELARRSSFRLRFHF